MIEISGKTQNLGVIGWPIGHSLSPAMQAAAIREAGLDYSYIAMPVRPEALPAAVEGLRSLGFRGFNVTIPHKRNILDLLDEIDEDAERIGAVNTVINEQGRLLGRNTDVAGFLCGLKKIGATMRGKRALLLGAGGAARAVIWGLIREKADRITVCVRDEGKARANLSDFSDSVDMEILSWETPDFRRALSETELIVNTTPLGMTPKTDAAPPVIWEAIRPGVVVYDIIYTPDRTRLLQEAEARGCRVMNGVPMLVGQGAEAFQAWTGVRPDERVMTKALMDALRN